MWWPYLLIWLHCYGVCPGAGASACESRCEWSEKRFDSFDACLIGWQRLKMSYVIDVHAQCVAQDQ
jgi:hypothetical protein